MNYVKVEMTSKENVPRNLGSNFLQTICIVPFPALKSLFVLPAVKSFPSSLPAWR